MENNIDKLFKQKLVDDVPPYDPNAWGKMAELIDQDDAVNGSTLATPNKWKRYLMLLLIGLIAAGGLYSYANQILKTDYDTSTNDSKDNNANTLSNISINDESTKDNIRYETLAEGLQTTSDNSNKASGDADIVDAEKGNNQTESSATKNIARVASHKSINEEENRNNESAKSSISDFKKADNIISINSNVTGSNLDQPAYESIYAKGKADNGVMSFHQKLNEETNSNDGYSDSRLDNSSTKDFTNLEEDAVKRGIMSNLELMNTITSDFLREIDMVDPIMIIQRESGRNIIGALLNFGVDDGLLGQCGLGYQYTLSNNWNIATGFALDYISYSNGPDLIVQDKTYSFGSSLVPRSIKLEQRIGTYIPVGISRQIGSLVLTGGIGINIHIAASASRDDAEGVRNTDWYSNSLFNPITIDMTMGLEFPIHRQVILNGGIIFRDKKIKSEFNSTQGNYQMYPTLGLRYIFSKF